MQYPLLDDEQLIRFLRDLHYNPIYRKRDTRVPFKSLLAHVDLSRQTGYEVLHRRYRPSPTIRAKVSLAAFLVRHGAYFTRRNGKWVWVYPPSLADTFTGLYPDEQIIRGAVDGHQNMGVSQQTLSQPVRQPAGSPAVPEMRRDQGQVAAAKIRNTKSRSCLRLACESLGRRFRPFKFSHTLHWKKQYLAQVRANRLAGKFAANRSVGGTGCPPVERKFNRRPANRKTS